MCDRSLAYNFAATRALYANGAKSCGDTFPVSYNSNNATGNKHLYNRRVIEASKSPYNIFLFVPNASRNPATLQYFCSHAFRASDVSAVVEEEVSEVYDDNAEDDNAVVLTLSFKIEVVVVVVDDDALDGCFLHVLVERS